MISVLICSVNPDSASRISTNIKETIGVECEVLVYNNSSDSKGICSVYNKLSSKAKYEYLCFVHEDVSFHTENWGTKLIAHFEADENIGLIGIAGGKFKSAAPSSWFPWFPDIVSNDRIPVMNIKQHHKNKLITHDHKNLAKEVRAKVAVVDGVWLCCTQSTFKKAKFDEKLLKGFHCYDIDFSLAVNQFADVVVVFDILVEHFSYGNYNRQWVEASYQLHKKWKWNLPLNFSDLSKEEINILEGEAREFFIRLMSQHSLSPLKILNIIWGINSFRFFHAGKFLLWNRNWLKYVKTYYKKKTSNYSFPQL
jgi:hypothetical protein